MTDDEINDSLRRIIRVLLKMPENSMRPANQTGAPTGSKGEIFGTVLITLTDQPGLIVARERVDPDDELQLIETGQQMSVATASIQFFRKGAKQLATRLPVLMQMSAATDMLTAAGLGLVGFTASRDIAAVADGFWEERAQIDFEISFISSEDQTLNTFGEFPISIETESVSSHGEVKEP